MTFAPPDVSRVGARRIGVANAVLWIAGSIVLVIVGATAAYAFVVAPYTGGGGLLGGEQYPWEADQPLARDRSRRCLVGGRVGAHPHLGGAVHPGDAQPRSSPAVKSPCTALTLRTNRPIPATSLAGVHRLRLRRRSHPRRPVGR